MNKTDKQILCIKNIFHDIQSITMPAISGFVHDVYIVKNADKKYICRFSNKITTEYNLCISKLLNSHGVSVPDITTHNFKDLYCETYEFINGKTLHEGLLDNMPQKTQDKIYSQLLDISCKIAKIQFPAKQEPKIPFLLKIVEGFFNLCDFREEKVLAHFDLHAKNVILDDKNNVQSLLDLDSVCKHKLSFAFVSMMAHAKRNGYKSSEIIKKYKMLQTNKPIISIEKQINIYYCLLCFYIDFLRKHLLNLRNK